MGKATILVIEDEEKQRRVVGLHLASADYEVKGAGTAEEGWKLAGDVDLILTDLKLPGMDGLELLEKLKAQNSHTPVIVMSAFGTVENAVEAMKRGAVDFLPKPFSLDHLSVVVEKALEVSKLRDENRELREALGERYQFENIIGSSPAMQEIFATIMRVAPTRATVLLAGESGVGKDMIARAIHQHSPRKDRPFVKINCTAIPENLMESELFGYEKGAFTGANISKPGKFEQANTGTVMLDEIGDVPASVQVKLLRILQEREFERLGSNKTQQTDVRVIAATNVDLRAALEQGTFREDLYYRLNVVPMNIPPLRERKEDIPYLVEHFAKKFGGEISEGAMERLVSYHWPGNVRELENVIERSILLAKGPRVEADDVKIETGIGRARPAFSDRGFPARRNDARSIRAVDHSRGAEARQRQQEPGGAAAGPDPQRPALPPGADGDRISQRRLRMKITSRLNSTSNPTTHRSAVTNYAAAPVIFGFRTSTSSCTDAGALREHGLFLGIELHLVDLLDAIAPQLHRHADEQPVDSVLAFEQRRAGQNLLLVLQNRLHHLDRRRRRSIVRAARLQILHDLRAAVARAIHNRRQPVGRNQLASAECRKRSTTAPPEPWCRHVRPAPPPSRSPPTHSTPSR